MADELRLFDAGITAQPPLHEDGDSTAALEALRRVAEAAREVAQAVHGSPVPSAKPAMSGAAGVD